MDGGFEGLEPVLEAFESLGDELRPDRMCHTRREQKYSRQALRKHFREAYVGDDTVNILLTRSRPPELKLSSTFPAPSSSAQPCVLPGFSPIEPGLS
jgi:hypothetical protein